MTPFSKLKKWVALCVLAAFIPSQAFAQGINIPNGSALNITDGTLTVPGFVTNAGTLSATTGTINLTGNWTNSGTVSPGTSTVNFNGGNTTTQYVNSGGAASTDAFYNLSHATASTIQLNSNPVLINNNFANTAGTFNANSQNMTVDGNWQNTSTFTPGTNTVTLGGTTQYLLGSTSFYDLTKNVTSGGPYTLYFQDGLANVTNVSDNLILEGNSSNNLNLRSTTNGNQAYLYLNLTTGRQTISNVDVKDNNAGVAASQRTLLARGNSVDSGNNQNWLFGNTTLTWIGTTSTEWNNPFNWDKQVVPAAGDTVIIQPTGGSVTYDPDLCPASHIYSCGAVIIGNLTIQNNATLTLTGQNLTIGSNGAGSFSNNGNVILQGNETLTLTQDATHGTFTFIGQGGGSSVTQTFQICAATCSNNVTFNNLVIDDTNVHQDTFALAANASLTVNGDLTLTSGRLNASANGATVAVTGSVTIAGGTTLDAPSAATSTAFTVGTNWTNNGTFNNDNGEVTFNTSSTSIIAGTTTFYDFNSTTAGKVIKFTAGTEQTVSNVINISGTGASNISLLSTAASSQWKVKFNNPSQQSIAQVILQDSNASDSAKEPICNNCTDNGDNTFWIFGTLSIKSPATLTTVGQVPTVIGTGVPGSTVYIRDVSDNLVATAKVDTNANYRVMVGQDQGNTGLPITSQLDIRNDNTLTVYPSAALTGAGTTAKVNVVASPSASQVPVISTINGNTAAANMNISGSTPTVVGKGAPGQSVTIQVLDASSNLVLAAGSGTVDASGNFTVQVSQANALPLAVNYLSVTVGSLSTETTSTVIQLTLTDPFGYIFNSTNNRPLQGATVTLYNATTKEPAAGVQSCDASGTCTAASSFTTGADGFYSFLAPTGSYYIGVSAFGYNFPSKQTSFPSGRSVITGSEGEIFNVGSTVFELDVPLDGTAGLLHITKTANKSEASVGDIITYTVNLQNLSPTVPVLSVLLNDVIPPGFKYIQDRVLLNGAPPPPSLKPTGQRPVVFGVGDIPGGATSVLQYQLVIGAGVTSGNYRNVATAQFTGGVVISNPAQASVKIIPDPVFDLGSVIGKVYFDWNENGIQDPPYFDPVAHETVVEKPVPNVQIVMEDGTIITTDRDGKFNIPGLLPGRHLFRLDERTLPPGSYLTTEKAMIVDVTKGSISKVNFGVNIDESQTKSRDAVFFNEKIKLTQDTNRPVPRLNAALFNVSPNAALNTEEVIYHGGSLVRQAEFRIFTNYSPFISSWHLDILDANTKKLIKSFQGTALNINDPIYWNGRDQQDVIVNPDFKYSYVLSVTDNKGNTDDTKEKPITIRKIDDDQVLKKELAEDKDILKDRADRYRQWMTSQATINNLNHQLIPIHGETIHLDRQGTDVRSMRIMKGNNLFLDMPLTQQYGLTPDELMASGFSTSDEKDNLEVILPNGDYSIDVVSAKTSSTPPGGVEEAGGRASPYAGALPAAPVSLEHYSRPLKVGDDYMMFVALGDAQAGYNIDTGHIEPIQDKTQLPGFYKEGKGAYYLKGQILGKYLVTSSFDSDRAQKALFRQLDPNVYYPVYGDDSTINYDATNTQGNLYLLVQWDKSSAIWGNYAVDFNDTEFSAFSRAYYGGKIDYQSVATTPYGDPHTKLVVYHAQVQQLPSHNEFLATGGSLYFLKYKNVIQGSDKVILQVRDAVTGLVIASQPMVNGADYELDNAEGRILFWQPVSMIAQSESIISNNLVTGNPIYVVVDYQYEANNLPTNSSKGARVAQAIGNHLVLGGTVVEDDSSGQAYSLEGTDATLHVTKDATIKAEYAQTKSQETGSYVSTDGGITFTSLQLDSTATGKAYGIKGDARLFDSIGLQTYFKWIGSGFGATATSSEQGKEMEGISLTWDMTPVTRLTASEDIQKLMTGANLQATTQVGASETDTTMIGIVHQAERLKLSGQFQLIETKNVINGIESTTNQRGATIAGEAQYDLTDRIKVTLGQQVDVMNSNNTATTLGISDRLTDYLKANVQETFSSQGHATTFGITNQIGKRIDLTTNYTLTSLNTGEVDKTTSVTIEGAVSPKITTTATVAQTSSSMGGTTTSASIGAKDKISDSTSLDVSLGKSQSSAGSQSGGVNVNLNGSVQVDKDTTITATSQASTTGSTVTNPLAPPTTTTAAATSFGLQATKQVNSTTQTNASWTQSNDSTGARTTTFGFGNNSKLNQELQAVTSNSFSFSPSNGTSESSQYGLVRTHNGQNLQANFTKASADQSGNISQSNIFGLTGDVNDKLALNGSIEHGRVQNLDGSHTNRSDFSIGAGYVLKDTETAVERLKNSLKLEFRIDKGVGTDSLHQFVLYDAIEGRITDNFTVNAKLDYSRTKDSTTGAIAERHKEIILGMAYRPVSFDNLNFITEYSYQEGYGGGLQQADALNTLSNQTTAQVFSAEGIYDINDKWQAAEKIAYRIENEADTGFKFTQTHTWLVIHRLNYKIDRDWTVSGEYRNLVQVEAKDNKQGVLLQATRAINQNTALTIGWNFTQYSDDLTNLNYTSMGPFVRLDGKFYDRTPEEKARDRAKWLDAKINQWAWMLIQKELAKKDSQIVLELNRLFALAKLAQKQGHYEESKQIYKDIISAGQIMYDEACEYIRGRISREEKLVTLDKTARDYFKGGEYIKARKIWEKVVEDASMDVLKLPTAVSPLKSEPATH